jgi:hypothetical protein
MKIFSPLSGLKSKPHKKTTEAGSKLSLLFNAKEFFLQNFELCLLPTSTGFLIRFLFDPEDRGNVFH